MNENVQIALVIGAVLIFALWMFKDRIDVFKFFVKGVSAKMEKRQETGINISNNTQDGNGNEISTEASNVNIEENLQQGDENLINAAATSKKK